MASSSALGPDLPKDETFVVTNLSNIVTGAARLFPSYAPLVAEALAVRDALVLANNLHFPKVVIESDALLVVRCWVSRECNGVAHTIAHEARNRTLPVNWLAITPQKILHCILKDKNRSVSGRNRGSVQSTVRNLVNRDRNTETGHGSQKGGLHPGSSADRECHIQEDLGELSNHFMVSNLLGGMRASNHHPQPEIPSTCSVAGLLRVSSVFSALPCATSAVFRNDDLMQEVGVVRAEASGSRFTGDGVTEPPSTREMWVRSDGEIEEALAHGVEDYLI